MASSESACSATSAPESSSSSKSQTKNSSINNDGEIFYNRKWRVELLKQCHVRYCRHVLLSRLSSAYEEADTQRMTLLHFGITSLDILNATESALKTEEKENIINWIYHLQITDPADRSGFQGSSTFMFKTVPNVQNGRLPPAQLFSSHITMTYAALVSLLTLGDDLHRIDRKNILSGVSALQNPDGSFQASLGCSEKDMRFVYCAVCTCYMLNDFSHINVPKLVEFIKSSFTFEGSFSSGYGIEGHAAYTFCAVASLFLLDHFKETFSETEIEQLRRWCLMRQEYGFSGRPNKAEDTCYSYWVVATLSLLESVHMFNHPRNIEFLLGNQNPICGGIGKCDNEHVDPLHTFMGLAGLALVQYEGLNPINPMLTMSEKAVMHMRSIHLRWKGKN